MSIPLINSNGYARASFITIENKIIQMKKIAINVPPKLAEAFEKADGESKRKAELFINAWLTDFFSKETANDRLFDIMKKATSEAASNGFDEKELQLLLKNG
jgi:hypothetical protein